MRRASVISLLLLVMGAASAAAQSHDFTLSLLGGVGGSLDAEPDPGFGNTALQLGFAWITEPKTQVGVRLGRLDLGDGQLESLVDSELSYLSVAGEYRFSEGYYDSGIFFGLGYYALDGTTATGVAADERSLGLVLGLSGDFTINRRFSILVELTGHYADFDVTQIFALGQVGLAYHF